MPLVVHVLAVVLIPLIGVGVLGARELVRSRQSALAADEVADRLRVDAAALALTIPLEIERVVSLAELEAADGADSGPDPGLLVDARARVASGFAELDHALGFDAARRGASTSIRHAIEDERIRLDTDVATSATIDTVFDGAMAFVASLNSSGARQGRGDALGEQTRRAVASRDLLARLANSTREELAVAAPGVWGDDVDPQTAVAAETRHVDAMDAVSERWPEEAVVLSVAHATLGSRTTTDSDTSLATGELVDQLDYATAVSDFVAAQGGRLAAETAAEAAEAERRGETTLLVFLVVALASAVVGAVVLRQLTRPLAAMRAQAERIAAGDFSTPPIELSGPSVVRDVTSALNDMTDTLHLVDDHMGAMASPGGGVEVSPELLGELPGSVGDSMRTSMQRLVSLHSRLQSSEERLAVDARTDSLTGVPNRLGAVEFLDTWLADHAADESVDVGFLVVDIDGFRSVNEVHGHSTGDAVLREIARRLTGGARRHDLVARLGSDRFLVVVSAAPDAAALHAAGRRLIEIVERPFRSGERMFSLSASVGAAPVTVGDLTMDVLERANAAVHRAKHAGRRRVEVFDGETQRMAEQQAELELALRQAIHHDELRLFMQPLADLATGRCIGAEALVRWERPDVGLVPPGDFIPLAERTGLIIDLERWVLGTACRRLAEWQSAGRGDGMRLAVNISGRHFTEGDLVGAIDAAVAATGADPRRLEIELTESHLLGDVERACGVLEEIRRRGVTVAIDDFGTGYSSMTYLQRLPVDAVKIDRSFVAAAAESAFDATIITSVVSLARALEIDVVAEGIETVDQLVHVAAAGVARGQGYLLARPAPPDDAEALMFGAPLFDIDRVAPLILSAARPVTAV